MEDATDGALELSKVTEVIAAGPFADTWSSLQQYRVPQWFASAKFGIFVHWGLFSVPAFRDEWYPRNMYKEGSAEFRHHVETYGPHSSFGYKDFIPQFSMAAFDAGEWAELFRRAGAQFVIPVAEHHDGFALYRTQRSRWNATTMGPCRDLVGELGAAVRGEWLTFGLSSHRAEHWWFMNRGTTFDSDVLNPATMDFYGPAQREELQPNRRFLEDWLLRTVELADRYQPELIYFDTYIEQPSFEPYLRQFAAYYYNRGAAWRREVAIAYKWKAFAPGAAIYDVERGSISGIRATPWQADTSVARKSWGYVANQEYKSVAELIHELSDVVAKNGTMLLNIGPRADGIIPAAEREILLGIGQWLAVNGEAIYGTVPWVILREGPTERASGAFTEDAVRPYTSADIRFTRRSGLSGEFVYAIVMDWPSDGRVVVHAWGSAAGNGLGDIERLELLGSAAPVHWERREDALVAALPEVSVTERLPGGLVLKAWLKPSEESAVLHYLHN